MLEEERQGSFDNVTPLPQIPQTSRQRRKQAAAGAKLEMSTGRRHRRK